MKYKRVFNIGSCKRVADPSPGQPLKTAIEMLSATFPVLRATQVYESDGVLDADGSTLVFDVVTPVNKVNG